MTDKSFDLVVIGSGPGGYVGAIKAAQNGLKVALVEKSEHLGGTCLNVGCIPTKALLHSAKVWSKVSSMDKLGIEITGAKLNWGKTLKNKDQIVDSQRKGLKFLMKKNKIEVFNGFGSFVTKNTLEVKSSDGTTQKINSKKFLLATGSKVRELPFAKSNGKNILTSDHILFIDHIPETLAVVGGGVVGMEFASLFGRLGSKVTVIELASQVLPFEDEEIVKEATKHFKKQNIEILTSTKLSSVDDKGSHCVVSTSEKEGMKFDKVLMSIGREPVTGGLNLDKIGVKVDARGFVEVDANLKTNLDNIFAIGDVISTPALAHTASAEAMFAADVISDKKVAPIRYESNPSAVYTWPEVASIGKTEKALKEEKIAYEVSKFPFTPMAKAKIEGADFGFIKLIYDPKYREILGVHIVGAVATEMIAEFSLGKVLETTVDEIAQTIHPHPTISETVGEVAHAALGHAIHM